jgi:hypothetical protein
LQTRRVQGPAQLGLGALRRATQRVGEVLGRERLAGGAGRKGGQSLGLKYWRKKEPGRPVDAPAGLAYQKIE